MATKSAPIRTGVVVAADGYLSVIVGTTTGAVFGCNLIEIIKTA